MKMTYTDALTFAIDTLTTMEQTEQVTKAIEKMDALRTTYTNRNANRTPMSDETKKARKEANAAKRAELMAKVLPALRDTLSKYEMGVTAKELYSACADALPEDFTANKVQYILLHEMADEVIKTEAKGKPNTYQMKG